ncbi:sensor histidine kinase [Virgibacillus ndiopensis]|uniref:sensor histidine kinase n=1 Tax=Virgibacillus ndiopensis TaxID=2004408 RepID=UPI000C089B85|nr:sensor histidine kinase [Virgibacillus ndiopensis]
MSLLEYSKDKRFFIVFYIIIMVFVSLIMFVSDGNVNNIIYINVSCFLFAVIYITIGYFYRRKFYLDLSEMIESGNEEIVAMMPEPQNYEQRLFLNLLKKIIKDNNNQLQLLYSEKRDQQEFIMSWIHEVKLPIAASRLLMENSDGKSMDLLVDKLEDELNKIDNYVEQALYYSRIDSFSKDYFITEINVNQIIKNSVKKYAKLFINKGIQFNMDEEQKFVHSDSKWLGFVTDQLIANALKYTDDGGNISIVFDEDSKEKRLVIQDTGVGIKPEDIHRVFERGFTGSIGRVHAKSTGMGLYLAKQLANKLGHDISIESDEGNWTKVVIHFPKIRNYYQLT